MWARGAEGNVARIGGEHDDLGGEVVDADVAGLGHGLGHARFKGGAREARADVVAGLRAGFDAAAVFEKGVGLEDGGDAHVALERHAADRGEAVAGTQRALIDELLERAREFDVEGRGTGGGERLDHGRREAGRKERAEKIGERGGMR